MKIIFLKGLPASGKSTFAKQLTDKNPGKYCRVNKDDLRAMTDNSKWSKDNEKHIVRARDALIKLGLEAGRDVIVDDTNFSPKHEADVREIANLHGADFEVQYFDTPVEECLKRDAQRPKPVGAEVIWRMYYESVYKKPTAPERRADFPRAVLCDMDGTLAHMNGRSPYEWKRVGEDDIDEDVKFMLEAHSEKYHIVLLSARDACCREETEAWLKKHGVKYDNLIMRGLGDKRGDEIVKREIFDEQVHPHWDIAFVIDDRPKVCRMWRELGLKVFQVGDPHREF